MKFPMTRTSSPNPIDLLTKTSEVLHRLGVPTPLRACSFGKHWSVGSGPIMEIDSPINGQIIAKIPSAASAEVDIAVAKAASAFKQWRTVPAPVRGQLVRSIGEELRQHKRDLAYIVTVECGKIYQEALGEVQEMIDICDFALGLSRQLYGLTIASERPMHRLTEQWHPLGPIGVISAFNFPVAVWAWNAMLALVCGDPVVWKPSEKTPLTAMACHAIASRAIDQFSAAPSDLVQLVAGGRDVGQALASNPGLPLVSATGSTEMGRSVAQAVGARLGRPLLELGGNNAAIVTPTADLELALRGIVFSAVGTCGQRCTSLRRLIVHESIADSLRDRLVSAYQQLPIGNPLDDKTLVGPLIDEDAFLRMQEVLNSAKSAGGVVHGGNRISDNVPDGFYVQPALVEIAAGADVTLRETFAPITVSDSVQLILKTRSKFKTAFRRVFRARFSPTTSGKPSCFARRPVPIAGSQTSILEPVERKSAVLLEARKIPGAAANPGPTHGKPTCDGPRTLSTTRTNCRWLKASSLMFDRSSSGSVRKVRVAGSSRNSSQNSGHADRNRVLRNFF